MSGFECITPIQTARRELSELCLQAASKPGGIFRLNLPTGAGKTLSGLRYALKHAEAFGKERIFFISPLLSILEQNAREIRKAIGDDSIVLEHHSDIITGELSDDELSRYELLCDSWNSPIVITTLVQFLNTLFSGKTASVRRFNSLANSVIVIDEVQTVPLKTLSLFNYAINFLSEVCNATVVLCSATQPYLEGIHRPLVECKDIIEPDIVKRYATVFKRNSITDKGEKRSGKSRRSFRNCSANTEVFLLSVTKRTRHPRFLIRRKIYVNSDTISRQACVPLTGNKFFPK